MELQNEQRNGTRRKIRRHSLAHGHFCWIVSCRRGSSAIHVRLESSSCRDRLVVDVGKLRGRNWFSQTVDPSWLQNAKVGRVLSDPLWHPRTGRGTHTLGGDAPHSSRAHRCSRRSAYAS